MTTGSAGEGNRLGAPAVPESAVWLKGQLLEIASGLCPDRGPVVAREWTDPVRLRDPAPVGHRFLFLIGMSWDDRSASPAFADVLKAFTAAGWNAHQRSFGHSEEGRATVRREDFEVEVYEGGGSGLLTLTGWTPVVYTERQLGRPPFTRSTATGVLCDDCYGWGVCMLCEGRPYSGGSGGYGRCWCAGNNAGPGVCVECAGRGQTPYGPPDVADGGAVPQPVAEDGHDTNVGAFVDVARRPCACGELRCLWRNTLSESGGRLLSRFAGTCQGCAAPRAYAFTLPRP
ncbi:hypothetical protein [Streptomyces sp. ITFR-16]|uniref:hypothetical protein n=1 Tax=Streptomyces sp. ITFR-16 TaxID=3075198 RepID=UPI00288AEA62|nr:hypothetical protein [Streptomyces sp. ITFR-16]WNI20461.1 hypothetical protein RLT58_00360 [Streptomyces sp. ITFR-16]